MRRWELTFAFQKSLPPHAPGKGQVKVLLLNGLGKSLPIRPRKTGEALEGAGKEESTAGS